MGHPGLPGLRCQSLRATSLTASPDGFTSAYGDIWKPLECTSTRWRVTSSNSGHDGEVGPDRVDAVALPAGMEVGQRPGAGGTQGDAAVTGTAYLTADHQQPGAEHGGGVGTLGVLEERRVDRAGAVVEGQEHHAPPGPDRRGLGGDLDPGDQDLGPAALAEEVLAADRAEGFEELGVGVDDVPAGVEAEDLQLGAHPLLGVHLGQSADVLLRLVAEVEGELHRGDRARVGGRAGLGRRLGPDALAGQRVALERDRALAGAGVGAGARGGLLDPDVGRPRHRRTASPGGQPASPPGALDRPGVPVELGNLEQQVAAGDLGPAANAGQTAHQH